MVRYAAAGRVRRPRPEAARPVSVRPPRLRAVHGVALLFLANGLSHPSLWPRLPELRDAVGATDATLGLALLGTGLGGVVGSAVAPAVARWLGTRRAAVVTAVLLAVVAISAGLAPSVPLLFAAFAVMGLTDGVADISQNHLLFEVQRRGARSLASRMHAVWSVGALGGTGIGTVAATAGVAVATQVGAIAVVVLGLAAVAARILRRGLGDPPPPDAEVVAHAGAPVAPVPLEDTARGGRPARALGRLGPRAGAWVLVAIAGVVAASIESVANEWSALTLRDGLGATIAQAGAGPTVFAAAMLVGRLVGDRAIDRFGPARVAAAGAAAVAIGAGAGLAGASGLDAPVLLLAGLAVAGIGAAPLFPLMLQAGDRLDTSGRGVAVASLAARAGMLAVPVSVGAVSDGLGPVVAFTLLPVAGAVAALVLPAALRRRADVDGPAV
ncbi:MFS transporter [Nitriliruptoraceae bacterium ZYF776]|nr:MFS transporter [Profundirhabdus halotolerans]